MVRIPFGYRIRDGKVEACPEERDRLVHFFRAYLDGMTIQEAGAFAGIPLSRPTLGRMLQNRTYLGDDYYPALLDEDLFFKAGQERQRRYEEQGRFGKRKPRGPVQVKTHFRMRKAETHYEEPVSQAAYLYDLIEGDDN